MKVLLVDDEPRVLHALQRMLGQLVADDCEIVTATTGEDALERMARSAFDVLVSDMRMPVMDGAELVRRVHAEHPDTLRIILSGHMAEDAVTRALPHAHQFLGKPCSSTELVQIIEGMRRLREMVSPGPVRRAIGALARLPITHDVYTRLETLLDSEHTTSADAAVVIEEDLALVAMTLRAANMSHFRRGPFVVTVERAIGLLGLENLRELVRSNGSPVRLDIDSERRHEVAVRTALIARRLACIGLDADRAREAERPGPHRAAGDLEFLTGLLVHTGRLVAAVTATDSPTESWAPTAPRPPRSGAVEPELSETTQAQMGAYLLGLWGFPQALIDALARQHDEPDPNNERVTLALQIARRAAAGLRLETAWLAPFPGATASALLSMGHTPRSASAASLSGSETHPRTRTAR